MASSAFYNASVRQQELLKRASGVLGGFSAENDITSVTYASGTEVPESITYTNDSGTITRNVTPNFGDLGLRPDEEAAIRNLRLENATTLPSGNILNGQSNRSSIQSSQFRDSTTVRATATGLSTLDNSNIINDGINSAVTSLRDSVNNRLQNSGLGKGAEILADIGGGLLGNIVSKFPSSGADLRVKISDPSGRIAQLGGALEALRSTDFKVVFPYTPEITVSHQANYTSMNPTHSNYEYLFYQNSVVNEISINANFSARNSADAGYVLAVQHFFRSATKMFYGQDDIAGLPPIVCRLEGHGSLQFGYIPIVITGFNVTLPSDVDYISAGGPNSTIGRVPTLQTMSITAKPIYSRDRITNEFSLTSFAQGQLLGDQNSGKGGFI